MRASGCLSVPGTDLPSTLFDVWLTTIQYMHKCKGVSIFISFHFVLHGGELCVTVFVKRASVDRGGGSLYSLIQLKLKHELHILMLPTGRPFTS